MKIAVTYENGQIFQHFGHSENFKIYETEGKNIVRAEVIGTDGAGHSALAAVLKDKGVDVLIYYILVDKSPNPFLRIFLVAASF